MTKLKIDKDLKNLISSLHYTEKDLLEASLKKDGCHDSIKVWDTNGEKIIVDGHNRYEICTKHNIPFTVKELPFDDIHDVKIWMIGNQLGRRNINGEYRGVLAALRYSEEKQKTAFKGNQHTSESSADRTCTVSRNLDSSEKTLNKIAKQAGVSASIIERNQGYAESVAEVSKNTGLSIEEVIDMKRSHYGTKETIIQLAKLDAEKQKEVVKRTMDDSIIDPELLQKNPKLTGQCKNIRDEISRLKPKPPPLSEEERAEFFNNSCSCSEADSPKPFIREIKCPCGCGWSFDRIDNEWKNKEK